MNEKDMLNRLKEHADDITPPDSLRPEAIEEMLIHRFASAEDDILKEHHKEKDSVKIYDFQTEKKRKNRFFSYAARYGSRAAICLLSVTVAWQAHMITELNQNVPQSYVLPEMDSGEIQITETETVEMNTAVPNTAGTVTSNTDISGGHMPEDVLSSAETSIPEFSAGTTESDTQNVFDSGFETASQHENTSLTKAGLSSSAASSRTESQPQTVLEDTLSYADSYEEIYEALLAIAPVYSYEYAFEEELEYEVEEKMLFAGSSALTLNSGAASDGAASASGGMETGSTAAGTGGDYSDTNKQEAGVDEADIIKTDGTWIYILRKDCTLAIVKADGAESETASITPVTGQDGAVIQELYLDGDTLHILTHELATVLENKADVYYTAAKRQTVLYTYDITDRSAPKLTGSVSQEGSYADSRKVGPYIYLFTTYYPDLQMTYGDSTITPRINGTYAKASDFYLPESLQDTTYLVISSVNAANPNEVADSKILVSGASDFYVSPENIYIANKNYIENDVMTEITKFHYADGTITGVAAASVNGYLNDSFSMNEHNGYLRTVTTYTGRSDASPSGDPVDHDMSISSEWTEHNGLFIFDASMKQVSSIENLAEGETIRSARFLGDTGYFVTFRQTDPLFSADLSDPMNPQILGELKISGFSSYLHFYGDDLLLGIGYEADEMTGVISGLKLSMFDLSDPSNVTESHRFILPGLTWCPALEDYKSILVSPEKNLIGFYCDNRYMVFSWDKETGFTSELIYDFYSDLLAEQAEYNTVRGLYIGNEFYIAGETFLVTFDMDETITKTGVVTL